MTSFIIYASFCIFKLIPNGTVYLLVCSLEETDILYDVLILAISFQVTSSFVGIRPLLAKPVCVLNFVMIFDLLDQKLVVIGYL